MNPSGGTHAEASHDRSGESRSENVLICDGGVRAYSAGVQKAVRMASRVRLRPFRSCWNAVVRSCKAAAA
jgi:hypothetical protein